MSKEIRLFSLTGVCLLLLGSIFIYLSGLVYPGSTDKQSLPNPSYAATVIVVTQTRTPIDNFVGSWYCGNKQDYLIVIEKNGNFYDVIINQNSPLIGTKNKEEIVLEDGSAMRLNNQYTKLLTTTTDGNGINCDRSH